MPDPIDEVVGQESAKRFVRAAIEKERLYNLLFTGPKGVGKRHFAFALSKILKCPPNSPNFMLIAPISSKIKDKQDKIFEYSRRYLPDNPVVQVEDRASILITQIRNLIERLITMPQAGSKRVVLMLEVDKLTLEAANCFLKTLEEPPIDTIFVLTTSRPNYVLPTICSRCQRVPFNYLSNEQMKEVLYDATDEFMLGSPGEILFLRETGMVERAYDIFRNAPLSITTTADLSSEFERKKIFGLFYPLLLLYRLTLYKKMGMVVNPRFEKGVVKKASRITLKKIIDTLVMLNEAINILEQNPNRLLLLLNILSRLP